MNAEIITCPKSARATIKTFHLLRLLHRLSRDAHQLEQRFRARGFALRRVPERFADEPVLHGRLAPPPRPRLRRYKNLRFQVWDLGGQTSIRPYWRCYYQNTNAVIYVVDSADTERMGISKQELVTMLEEEELKDAALMVFANKQDLPNAATAEVIAEKLGLSALKNRQWQIFKTSALKGDGLYDGLDWLISTLRDK